MDERREIFKMNKIYNFLDKDFSYFVIFFIIFLYLFIGTQVYSNMDIILETFNDKSFLIQ